MKRIFACLAVIFLTACNSSSDPEVVGINLLASPSNIAVGDNTTLSVELVYDDESTTSLAPTQVSFNLSDDDVAELDGSQLVSKQEGSVGVTASYEDYSDTITINIHAAEIRDIVLSDEEVSLSLGQSYVLEIYAQYSDGRLEPLEGASIQIMDTAVVDIDNYAEVLQLQSNAVGQSEVLVTFEQLEATLTIEVTDAVAKRIVVGVDDSRIAAGETTQVFATATLTDNSHMDVSEHTVFTTQSNNIELNGNQVTGLTAGDALIEGSFEDFNANVDLEVTPAILTSLHLEASQNSLPLGTDLVLSAQASYSDGDVRDISHSALWTVSDDDIVAVSSEGVISALNLGNVEVFVEYEGLSASNTFTVTEADLESIAVSPEGDFDTFEGATFVATATGSYTDGSQTDISSQVAWSSSDSDVGSVSNHSDTPGRIQAKAIGTTTISASLDGQNVSFELTVVELPLVSVEITTEPLNGQSAMMPKVMRGSAMSAMNKQSSSAVPAGRTVQLYAIGTFENGDIADVTTAMDWTIANTDIAQFTDPNSAPGKVRGRAVGTTTVSVEADNGVTGSYSLNVADAVLDAVVVVDNLPSEIFVGDSVQLSAEGQYSDGSEARITSEVSWQVPNTDVFTVSNQANSKGLLTAQGVGSATVTVALSGISGEKTIDILNPITGERCDDFGFNPTCSAVSFPYSGSSTRSTSRIPAPSEFEAFDPVTITALTDGVTVTQADAQATTSHGCRVAGISEGQELPKGEGVEVQFLMDRTFGQTQTCNYSVQFNNSDDLSISIQSTLTTN